MVGCSTGIKATRDPLFVAGARLDILGDRLAIYAPSCVAQPILHTPAAVLLEPTSSISGRAIELAAAMAIPVIWTGPGATKYVSHAGPVDLDKIRLQARIAVDGGALRRIARHMLALRYPHRRIHPRHSLHVIRGIEGACMREEYRAAAAAHGVAWNGRSIHGPWGGLDAINRTLSIANSCLYGLTHAAIIAAGYRPEFGVLHSPAKSSRPLVFDVADLVKTEITIPLAFRLVAAGGDSPEWVARAVCAREFRTGALFGRLATLVAECIAAARMGT